MNIEFRKTNDFRKNGMHYVEYVVWGSAGPIDRFQMFYTGGQWNAWVGDTMSETTKARRRAFAAAQSV